MFLIAFLALVCMSGQALADLVIIQPTNVVSDIVVAGTTVEHADCINGLSLSANLITGDAVPVSLPTEGWQSWQADKGVRWQEGTGNNANGYITYQLGGAYDLEDVIFWNYGENNGNTDRGIKSVTASFSTDGVSFAGDTTLNFPEADSNPTAGETVNLVDDGGVAASNLLGVTHVKFTDFVNHSPASPDPDHETLIGYGEIRFTWTPPPIGTVISIQ